MFSFEFPMNVETIIHSDDRNSDDNCLQQNRTINHRSLKRISIFFPRFSSNYSNLDQSISIQYP